VSQLINQPQIGKLASQLLPLVQNNAIAVRIIDVAFSAMTGI
jgi:hypothetical protein